ncbi:MAG: LysM peptidoglycan-binding domain-containing protein [Bacteroidales bacterium]|nr:MAG: LysM peptidoglycan-binding domain-containing protein [Bacteroidales bacterium]
MKIFYYLFFIAFLPTAVFAQKKQTRDEYINRYKDVAIYQMKTQGVPASIILAQGLLESDNGNSYLAVKANNHFGIKCHKTWSGPTVHQDDDARNECFRKYSNPEKSYKDHSDFLRGARRYALLFDLEPTDYKGWSYGLKKAGYATNPHYAEMLIKIIEDNSLYAFDRGITVEVESPTKGLGDLVDIDKFVIDMNKHRKVYTRNRIKYIIVKKGDNYASLTKELELLPWQLASYNEISKDSSLKDGQELYIQPKRTKAEINHSVHVVEKGETMYSISQMYGIKMKSLYRKNRMQIGNDIEVGQVIHLRKRKAMDR